MLKVGITLKSISWQLWKQQMEQKQIQIGEGRSEAGGLCAKKGKGCRRREWALKATQVNGSIWKILGSLLNRNLASGPMRCGG